MMVESKKTHEFLKRTTLSDPNSSPNKNKHGTNAGSKLANKRTTGMNLDLNTTTTIAQIISFHDS